MARFMKMNKTIRVVVLSAIVLFLVAGTSWAVRYYREWRILSPLKEKIAETFSPEDYQLDHVQFEGHKVTSLNITVTHPASGSRHLLTDCQQIQAIVSQYIKENPDCFMIDKDHYFDVTYSQNAFGYKKRDGILVFSNEDNTYEITEGRERGYHDTFQKLCAEEWGLSSVSEGRIPLSGFSVFTDIPYLYLDMQRCVVADDITPVLEIPDLKYLHFSGFEEEEYRKWSSLWGPLFKEKGILAGYEGHERLEILLGEELGDRYRIESRSEHTGRIEALFIDVDTSLVTDKTLFSDLEVLKAIVNDHIKKYPHKFARYPGERVSASKGFEIYFRDGNQDDTGIFSLCNYTKMNETYEDELCSLRFYTKKIGEYSFLFDDIVACTGIREIVCYPGMKADDSEVIGNMPDLKYLYWNPSDKKVTRMKKAAEKYGVKFLAQLPYE